MIPRDYLTAWRSEAPWVQDFQVEQDLVISRALVDIFTHPALNESFAFRGGTALYKLYIRPAARYSEDIDLVQVRSEPIGAALNALREALGPWLGDPRIRQGEGRVTLTWRFESEDNPPLPLRLKIEINSREHFSVFELTKIRFAVSSRWFSGEADVVTYALNELLGTKMRALYQRSKGRDLFDLALALRRTSADPSRIIQVFLHYMEQGETRVTRAMFEQNLAAKLSNPNFMADLEPLLSAEYSWEPNDTIQLLLTELISRLPGEPWKGDREI